MVDHESSKSSDELFEQIRQERAEFSAYMEIIDGTAGDLTSISSALHRIGLSNLAAEITEYARDLREARRLICDWDGRRTARRLAASSGGL